MVHIYDITLSVMSQWHFLSICKVYREAQTAQAVHMQIKMIYICKKIKEGLHYVI